MKSSTPKGIVIFSIIILASTVLSAKSLFNAEAKIALFGIILSGLGFIAYHTAILIINLVIAAGIALLKKWAFQAYFALSAFYITSMIANYVLIDDDALKRLGWEIKNNSMHAYRTVTLIGLAIVICLAFWLFCYRNYFTPMKKAA